MSFSNTESQHSTEDVAETLRDIEYTVLTWPSAAHTNEDRRLRKSMVESLESILAHLQSDDDVSLSDGEDDEDECVSNHGALSEDGGELDLDNNEVFFFSFRVGRHYSPRLKTESLNKDECLIISRCQNIVACGAKGLVKPMELVDALLAPDARFRHIAEDVGLGRIYRGYDNVSDDHWVINCIVS
jgi:hypothetical protein